MKEQWKLWRITRYKGVGKIRSVWEISNYGRLKKNGEIVKLSLSNSGYLVRGSKNIHVIVAETFIGKIPKGYQVDHIDGNKLNNKVDNLRIVTRSENMMNPVTRQRRFGQKRTEETKYNVSINTTIAQYILRNIMPRFDIHNRITNEDWLLYEKIHNGMCKS